MAKSETVKVDKEVVCAEANAMFKALADSDYKEIPVWHGVDSSSHYGLITNQKTGTWTIIQFNHEMVCILGIGKSSRILELPNKKKD